MRLAHGFKFRPRDWSIIAYFNGTARRLIDLGIHSADAAEFAIQPYRGLSKSSTRSIATSIIDSGKQEQSES